MPDPSTERRIDELLGQMTLEEKIAQLASHHLDWCLEDDQLSVPKFQEMIEKLGIGVLHNATLASGHEEVGAVAQHAGRAKPDVVNQAQKYLVENTRLGIPALVTAEGIHGHMCVGATVFPHSIASASSWNPELLQQAAAVIGKEARAVGVTQILSPVFDLAREPRWGRTQETYGEDPYLAARMGVAFVKGLQGGGFHIDASHAAATPKHFAAHGSPEGGINIGPVYTGPRELRELYLPPFEAAVREGQAAVVMNCYSEVDGVPVAGSREMLTDILRGEWGFQGYVYSDWGSIDMLHRTHKTAADTAEAGKQALEAGLDLEGAAPQCYGRRLLEMVQSGRVAEETVDTAVRRVLRVKFRLGLFENPYVDESLASTVRNTPEHRALALQIARESLVLLKNEQGMLPLCEDVASIAVIGPNADIPRLGNYSGYNDELVTVLEGIKRRLPAEATVRYAEGCGVFELSTEGIAEAVEVARDSEVAVLVLGESNVVCEEGVDQSDLELPGVQMELVRAVHATGTPIVAVLLNGRPLAIPWLAENVPAILEAWYPGEEGGTAIAEVLFGDCNPSGKLPVSLPRSVGHLPCYYNHKFSARGYYKQPGEPGRPGRDYVFSLPTALYEFGHGLSYTEFAYSDLEISPEQIGPQGEVKVAVTVKNVGARAGAEVVQCYVNDLVSSVTTRVKVLRGFQKVQLEPGEARQVEFTLGPEDLRLLDRDMQWVVEPGDFEVLVGDLSATLTVA